MTASSPSIRDRLRAAGLGRLAYKVLHGSFPRLRWPLRFGARGAARYIAGEAAMRRAVSGLPPVACDTPGGFACSFLTGRHYWHQTAFCVHSLSRHLPEGLRITIHEDGTLSSSQRRALLRVLRGASISGPGEAAVRLDRVLPRSRYPRLRAARDRMPFMRKLLDLRAGAPGWQLYLDSDMLFHGRPGFLLERSTARAACHMHDRVPGYCLSPEELAGILGRPVPPNINAGIVGLDDSRIDWDLVEHWLAILPHRAHHPQFLEQTLTALLLGLQGSVVAPPDAYHILYDETPPPPGFVLLHFIYHAKFRYFTRDWRDYIRSLPASSA